jgi:hypothetical protein
MAAPTITLTGSGSSKTSGTTLAVTVTTTAYAVGDCLVVGFSMDPQTGAVSFAQTAGTATVGAFTTEQDVATGSGTSGIRTVMAWAYVTAAGTITTVTVTHPTATARAAETFNATGVDVTFPVNCSGSAAGTSEVIAGLTPTALVDVAALLFRGFEIVAGTAAGSAGSDFNQGTTADWVLASADSVTAGTSGAGSASNISVAYTVCAPDPAVQIGSDLITVANQDSTTTNAVAVVVFQATAPLLAHLTMTTPTGA